MLVVGNGSAIKDGDSITIKNAKGESTTYTYTTAATPGANEIGFKANDSVAAILSKTIEAINKNSSASGVTASGSGNRISLTGDLADAADPGLVVTASAGGLSIQGEYGTTNTAIAFEETDASVTLLATMKSTIEGQFPITPGWVTYATLDAPLPSGYSDRITFLDATSVTFSASTVFQHVGDSAAGAKTGLAIKFHADDLASEIAASVAAAINNAHISTNMPGVYVEAKAFGGTVELVRTGTTTVVTMNTVPFDLQNSGGAGGDITGLAILGNVMYAVDNHGGLYRVDNLNPTANYGERYSGGNWGFVPVDPEKGVAYWTTSNSASAPVLTPIATLVSGGQSIEFSGLTLGPQNVENGDYANLLFATDAAGNLYALDPSKPTSVLQAVFASTTHTSVELTGVDGTTPLGKTTGVAFSTLDYNLWHETNTRSMDVGHGINTTYDSTRNAVDGSNYKHTDSSQDRGWTSYYFGLENPTSAGQPNNGPLAAQPRRRELPLYQPKRIRHLQSAGRSYGFAGIAEVVQPQGLHGCRPAPIVLQLLPRYGELDQLRWREGVCLHRRRSYLESRGHQHRLG